jgi:hypothetical protein
MESTLLKVIQREEVMTKHWECKLMFKEEEDGSEIDLLDYVNFRSKTKTRFQKTAHIRTSAYTHSLIDSMVLKTGPS